MEDGSGRYLTQSKRNWDYRRIVVPLLLMIVLTLIGCGKPINEIELTVDEGLWHDTNLTNRSAADA